MVTVNEMNSFSPLFYVTIISVIVIIGLIVFFIRKSKHNWKQILKGFGISALITLVIEFLIWLYFGVINPIQVSCKMGINCPSPAEISFGLVLYLFIPIFLIVLFVYYLIIFF